ncbi:MAG: DUF2062 domain-containing protein [Gloeobacterales cyanobacterium]
MESPDSTRRIQPRRRNVFHSARLQILRLARVNDAPEKIARGVALGCWVTSVPTFGLATPVALLLAPLFRANVVAATVGALLIGILPAPTSFAFLGAVILGLNPKDVLAALSSLENLQQMGSELILAVVAFPLLFGAVASVGCYFGTLWALPRLRQRVRKPQRNL